MQKRSERRKKFFSGLLDFEIIILICIIAVFLNKLFNII